VSIWNRSLLLVALGRLGRSGHFFQKLGFQALVDLASVWPRVQIITVLCRNSVHIHVLALGSAQLVAFLGDVPSRVVVVVGGVVFYQLLLKLRV
jgi:hypothetical protein